MNTDNRNDPQVQAKWAKIRRSVIKKRGRRCEVCGSTRNIEVHHEYDWKHYPMYRFTERFLRVLCRRCHVGIRGYHTWRGGTWLRDTPEHFQAWLKYRRSSVIIQYLLVLRDVTIILLIAILLGALIL